MGTITRAKSAAGVALVALILAGCGGGVGVVENRVWVRMDGQSGRENPALAAQFAADQTACRMGGQVNEACMNAKGYIYVPAHEAETKAAELRAAGGTMPAVPN